MIVEIDALDTLFFRDGKPFTMAENRWADTVFPPFPSVIYGALRSAYFANHIEELGKAKTDDDPTKNLKIKGIYYDIGNDIYLPLPQDCVKEKNDKDKVSILSMIKNESRNSCPTSYLLSNKDGRKVENVPDGFIRKSIFEKYLIQNAPEEFFIKKISDYVLLEPKIGIGRSSITHSTEEGKLYRVDMKRLVNKIGESLSLVIDFEGLNLPEEGLMKLGGEGKAVSYEKFKPVNLFVDKSKLDRTRFKLYLSTPAIFENGWLPEWMDKETLTGKYSGLKLRLLTASIGKPLNIGGFDMKERKPKPMYKAVPAGSVYYFEITEGDIQKVFEIFNQKAISDLYPEQGFGMAYVGKISEGDRIL